MLQKKSAGNEGVFYSQKILSLKSTTRQNPYIVESDALRVFFVLKLRVFISADPNQSFMFLLWHLYQNTLTFLIFSLFLCLTVRI